MLQLGTILNSKSFAITVADTRFISPNPSNYPNFDFLLIDLLASILLLYHNSKAPFQQCSTLLMEQQKARLSSSSLCPASAAQYNSRKAIPQQGMPWIKDIMPEFHSVRLTDLPSSKFESLE
ncbi:hypothetical protein KPL70_024600 [Citrus sinensis]|nr:hypothetical protein KPL70_024600 [Citrus sinensis]